MASAPSIASVFDTVKRRDPDQGKFLQAVEEVFGTLSPILEREPKYISVLASLCEPERAIVFRVPWIDDQGVQQVNRGFRVQFNQAIGPYKGGLRFHPSVDLSTVKFLGFEQILKNSLTGLPMGGGKGGSDFDPKGKSNLEVKRFTESFMNELYRHIGPNVDVPAGDIGVGAREIGYLYGQYKRITKAHEGVLTGKGIAWGGSLMRPEATGYGLVYITQHALQEVGQSLEGQRVLVSGAGNVAQFAVEKLQQLGAVVLTMSDSGGYVFAQDGLSKEQVAEIADLKAKRGRLSDYQSAGVTYVGDGAKPWTIACDVALPCATENEVDEASAQALLQNGCKIIAEGANMPSSNAAVDVYKAAAKASGFIYVPAKAANAGGVAVSGLEMSQNSERLVWTRETVDERLAGIMKDIFATIKDTAAEYGRPGDYQLGANIAGFKKVADAMLETGVVFRSDTY